MMKQFLYIFALIAFLYVSESAAQSSTMSVSSPTAVSYARYDDSYFQKNTVKLKGDPAYMVVTSQKDFDKLFGAAATMGKNNFLPKDTFPSKIVISTVKQGDLRKYEVYKVESEGTKLMVWYTTMDEAPSSATFRSPLIIAADKGKYKQVVFMENGKSAATVKVK